MHALELSRGGLGLCHGVLEVIAAAGGETEQEYEAERERDRPFHTDILHIQLFLHFILGLSGLDHLETHKFLAFLFLKCV